MSEALPTISCLTVTRAARLPLLARAVSDYAHQTHGPRQLVIVHDEGPALTSVIGELVAHSGAPNVTIRAEPAGQTLGALRNASVDAADGELVCQWDDDDRYHPERLAVQAAALQAASADFAFLTDQLHLFTRARRMTWDTWRHEPHPLDFIQGTLLGRRTALPRYPGLARGEDTSLCRQIAAAGARIARIDDAGWCYVYVCHGDNVWSDAHHWAIAQAKALGPARLLARTGILAQRLPEYAPAVGNAVVDAGGHFISIL
jgi:glycosyltransferase involved in cell wall biosynthesis